MGTSQITTPDFTPADIANIEKQAFMLSPAHQAFVDYKALGGMYLDKETDTWRVMTMTELARRLGIDRKTLYDWRELIPGFWDRVAERRKELNAGEWLFKVHQTWKVKAAAFEDWRITEAWLRNFDRDYREPRAVVQHEAGNSWGALLEKIEPTQASTQPIEGEVVNAEKPADNGTV